MKQSQDQVSRRQFMINTAFSTLGVSVLPMLGQTTASAALPGQKFRSKAKSVIFLNMNGGMSHLDTFDPKPKKKEVQGPVDVIKTNVPGIHVTQYLPKMAQQMDKACVINSMSTNQGAHEQGQYIIHRSYAPRGTVVHPSIGAWVMRLSGRRNHSIPGFVSIGGGENTTTAGFLGANYAGVPIRDPNSGLENSVMPTSVTEEDFKKRLSVADRMNHQFHTKYSQQQLKEHTGLYDEAMKLMESRDLKAFDLRKESTRMHELYGDNRFGKGCLLARRLVEHNVRFVEVSLGGWDTHYDNFTSVEARCATLDQALSGLLTDLHRRGLLEDTLVALGTEFGRTPEIQVDHNNGRDHHPQAFSCLLMGGGVRGGQVYGESDSTGNRVKDKKVTPPMFNATIAYAMGLPHDHVVKSPSGRPFTISDKSQPITEIF